MSSSSLALLGLAGADTAAANSVFGAAAASAAALLLLLRLTFAAESGASDGTVLVAAAVGGGWGGAKLPILKFGLNMDTATKCYEQLNYNLTFQGALKP